MRPWRLLKLTFMYPSNLRFYGFLAGWSEDLMTGYFQLNEQSVTNNAVYVANQTSIQGVQYKVT